MSWNLLANILFDILTYGIFFYSLLLLLSYIIIALFSVGETQKYLSKNKFTDYRILAKSPFAPSVSILAPAYNEGKTIVENVRSLLSIYYSNLEVIIINDGSKDDCLEQLIKAYDLYKVEQFVHQQIPTKDIRGIYKSKQSVYHKLIVVDKVNGGKADALNVGINISSNKYLICIDVDCILEQDALLKMVKPFLEQTDKRVIATGGVVRIANSCVIEDGRLIKVKLSEDYLPRIQILEYIRAFILGRMAWSRLNGLMLISGAFGAFDKEIAIKCGGYDHNTVGEDMELVVRMRRYMEERNEKYVVTYIPDPLCWTEAPSSFQILGRQRNRWIRGTYETLKMHRVMFFNPKYHLLGLLSYPYWFFFELCAPIIEFFGFSFFFIFAWTGFLDWSFFFSFLFFIICFGYLYSSFAILMEVLTFNQYKRRVDIFRLMLTGLTEPFYYHPFVVWSAIKGYLDLIKKKNSWGEMTRSGFAKQKAAPYNPAELIQPPVYLSAEETGQSYEHTIHIEKPEEKASWVMERTIIPIISRGITFISKSLHYFFRHAIVLYCLLIGARVFEMLYEIQQHGIPQLFIQVLFNAVSKDTVYFLQLCFPVYFVFTFFYIIHKKAAHVFFISIASILLVIQIVLSIYFIKTLVPLGADLWGYSLADIRQTVGASGGVSAMTILLLVVLLASVSMALVFLPKKIKIHGWLAFLFFVIMLLTRFTQAAGIINNWMPGQEYGNNLALNKMAYFSTTSYQHFFPEKEENDIYSNNYSGDYVNNTEDAKLAAYKYVDEKNYPFLHVVDSSKDVLSPFFTLNKTMPNIVIILVEGLGRAFTNKGAYLGNFTPFIDSLSDQSLYWDNFLSEGARTFAALPSLLGSLPFAKNGFNELGADMPQHFSLLNLLKRNGYTTTFNYGGDARFDNMDLYLKKNNITAINDERNFPQGFKKMPAQNGFTWGYGDKELFTHFLQTTTGLRQPSLDVLLTVSTHNPFFINEQSKYLDKFEKRMGELGFSESEKNEHRNFKYQYASILYTDDAVKEFIEKYRQRPDFNNTIFLITGDHRMPEIPMSSKIDRYHVPLIIYSALLKRRARFSSISTHFDITPSLLSMLNKKYQIQLPEQVSFMGAGLDTNRQFRNIHAYPIMQTKTEIIDFIKGEYLINGNTLYHIGKTMDISVETNEAKFNELNDAFNRYKNKNALFVKSLKLLPDTLLKKFLPN